MAKPTIEQLNTEIELAKQRLDVFEKWEEKILAHIAKEMQPIHRSVERVEAKLNNGITDEVRKNTQFRKVGTWVVGVLGTVILSGFAVAIWKLLVNLDKLLEIANNVK